MAGARCESDLKSYCGGSHMKLSSIALSLFFASSILAAQTPSCDFSGYKPMDGVKAETKDNAVILTWQGEADQQLQAQFAVHDGQPFVQQLAARAANGTWIVLGRNQIGRASCRE